MYKKQYINQATACFQLFWDFILLCLFAVVTCPMSTLRSLLGYKRKSFKKDVILVTGGANGVGRELCLRIGKLESNCTIICWDIDEHRTLSLISELKSLGVKNAAGFKIDVCDRFQVQKGFQKIRADFGDVSILFNSVNQSLQPKPFWKTAAEEIESNLKTNLLSQVWILHEVLPPMIRRDYGYIVTVSSLLTKLNAKNNSIYDTAKNGIHGCTAAIRTDLASLPEPSKVRLIDVFTSASASTAMDEARQHLRHSFLFPPLTAEMTAIKIIDSMTSNASSVYVPGYSWLAVVLRNFTPYSAYSKTIKLLLDSMSSSQPEALQI